MALKLKQYTPKYAGLDGAYYLDREAPVIAIVTNRNAGKTTNILGEILKRKKHFLLVSRFDNEFKFMKSKLYDACQYYGVSVVWDNKSDAFIDEDGKKVGYLASLSGNQKTKQNAAEYHSVEYIILDEFLPSDHTYLCENSKPGYELEALKTIMGSVRKGGEDGDFKGRQFKTILLANLVDAINPYLCNIFDSKGTSLLTHIAKTITGSNGEQTNLTIDDPMIYLTLHIDKRFETDDPLGRFINGGTQFGMCEQFLADFRDKVKVKTSDIEKQLKRPILSTGSASMYLINLRTTVDIGSSTLSLTKPVYYWAPSKYKASKETDFQAVDLDAYQHWYSSIIIKAEVKDFFKYYRLHARTGIV